MSELIIGIRPLLEAIKSEKEIDKVLVQKGIAAAAFGELRALLIENNIPMQFVPVEKLNRMTKANHQGVIGYMSQLTYQNIDAMSSFWLSADIDPIIVMLDRVTDVRNMGAIARSIECSGAQALLIPERGSAQINEEAIKSSAGALMKIAVCRTPNSLKTLESLKKKGFQIVACTEKTDDYLYEVDFTLPTVLIMGSEEDGISSELMKVADKKVKIPMLGSVGSLNVSVAAGVFLYEAVRQRSGSR